MRYSDKTRKSKRFHILKYFILWTICFLNATKSTTKSRMFYEFWTDIENCMSLQGKREERNFYKS